MSHGVQSSLALGHFVAHSRSLPAHDVGAQGIDFDADLSYGVPGFLVNGVLRGYSAIDWDVEIGFDWLVCIGLDLLSIATHGYGQVCHLGARGSHSDCRWGSVP